MNSANVILLSPAIISVYLESKVGEHAVKRHLNYGMLALTMAAGSAVLPTEQGSAELFAGFNITADAASSVPSKTVKSEKEIVDFVKTQLKNHTETFKITINSNFFTFDRMDELIHAAFVNTSEPMGGDFAYVHATGKKHWVVRSTDNKNFTITMTYAMTQSQYAAVEKEMNRIIGSLKLNGKTQRQKADAIYNYVCKNTKYYNNGGSCYYAYGAFVEKKAVCQGMALELYALMKKAGIDCRIVDGYSEGVGHAWNKIKLGNSWYYIDAAYDCGRNPANYRAYLKTSLSQMPGNRYEDKSMENPANYKDYKVSSSELKSNICKATVDYIPAYTYDGTAKKPSVTVKYGTKTLVKGTDYTVSYSNNVNAGRAKATITGKGSYEGTITKEFCINSINIKDAVVTLSRKEYYYDGTAKKPSVTVKVGGKTLKNGTDYTLTYQNNVSVGNPSVMVNGKGNYVGITYGYFKILNVTKINVGDTKSGLDKYYSYTGKAIKPKLSLTYKGTPLTEGKDYTITKYTDNVKVGKAYVHVKFINAYSGSLKYPFNITDKIILKPTDCKVAGSKSYKYTGKAITPKLTLKYKGKALTEGKDYTVSYTNNTNVGTATAHFAGKGAYVGNLKIDFQIVK